MVEPVVLKLGVAPSHPAPIIIPGPGVGRGPGVIQPGPIIQPIPGPSPKPGPGIIKAPFPWVFLLPERMKIGGSGFVAK